MQWLLPVGALPASQHWTAQPILQQRRKMLSTAAARPSKTSAASSYHRASWTYTCTLTSRAALYGKVARLPHDGAAPFPLIYALHEEPCCDMFPSYVLRVPSDVGDLAMAADQRKSIQFGPHAKSTVKAQQRPAG